MIHDLTTHCNSPESFYSEIFSLMSSPSALACSLGIWIYIRISVNLLKLKALVKKKSSGCTKNIIKLISIKLLVIFITAIKFFFAVVSTDRSLGSYL